MRTKSITLLLLVFCAGILEAQSIVTRARVMENARSFRDLQWPMNARNVKVACAPPTSYIRTPFPAGSSVTGMAYNYGGKSSISEFLSGITGSGFAGNRCTSTEGNCCLRAGTHGTDCSGFVQRAWQYPGAKLGTGDLARTDVTSSVRLGNAGMRSGDIFLLADSHTALFSHVDQNGNPWVVEASAVDWKVTQRRRSWSTYASYQKRRYRNLQDGGIAKIDQGIVISTRPKANRAFTATFRLRETDGAPIRYDDVTVAILDQNGRFKFDMQHTSIVSLNADGTVSLTLSGAAPSTPGSYIAVARGRLTTWSDFLMTSGGRNSVWFSVER